MICILYTKDYHSHHFTNMHLQMVSIFVFSKHNLPNVTKVNCAMLLYVNMLVISFGFGLVILKISNEFTGYIYPQWCITGTKKTTWSPSACDEESLDDMNRMNRSNYNKAKTVRIFIGKYWIEWIAPITKRKSWWRHQMKTFSALLTLCAGNSPVPVNSPHKGQWLGALMFSLICAWIND